jgi:hypothetical protein
MHKFSWWTMLIFVTGLFLGVMLIGLGTAYISKLKQQRRQPSNTSLLAPHPNAETDLHLKVAARNPSPLASL